MHVLVMAMPRGKVYGEEHHTDRHACGALDTLLYPEAGAGTCGAKPRYHSGCPSGWVPLAVP